MSQSGSSKPEPSKTKMSDKYAQILELPLPLAERLKCGLWPGATWGDAVALETVKAAASGNVQAMREIRESTEGKAIPRIPEPADTELRFKVVHIGSSELDEDGTPIKPRTYEEVTKTNPGG